MMGLERTMSCRVAQGAFHIPYLKAVEFRFELIRVRLNEQEGEEWAGDEWAWGRWEGGEFDWALCVFRVIVV